MCEFKVRDDAAEEERRADAGILVPSVIDDEAGVVEEFCESNES